VRAVVNTLDVTEAKLVQDTCLGQKKQRRTKLLNQTTKIIPIWLRNMMLRCKGGLFSVPKGAEMIAYACSVE